MIMWYKNKVVHQGYYCFKTPLVLKIVEFRDQDICLSIFGIQLVLFRYEMDNPVNILI